MVRNNIFIVCSQSTEKLSAYCINSINTITKTQHDKHKKLPGRL